MNPKQILSIISYGLLANHVHALSIKSNSTGLITPTIIHQFEPTHWLENLHVRPNGQLLINSQTSTEMFLLDPAHPENSTLVHRFPGPNNAYPGDTGLGGIVETTPDTYAILLGNLNHTTLEGSKGSFSLWTIDLQGYPAISPRVTNVTGLPSTTFPNGLTALPDDPTVILACDSFDGSVYRIDTITGEHHVVIQPDETTVSPTGAPWFIGIDGIRVYQPENSDTTYLYYNNYIGEAYYRVPIDANLATPIGPVETLATGLGQGLDDLDIDQNGASWIAVGQAARIVRVDADGRWEIAAEHPDLMFTTAVRQGRTCSDAKRFYFCTGLGKVGYLEV